MAKNIELRIGGVPQSEADKPEQAEAGEQPATDEAGGGADAAPKSTQEKIIDRLREVYDPEIPVNIYELGLIYEVDVDEEKNVRIEMTLTSPACPVAESLPGEVRREAGLVPEVKNVEVDLVWEPAWTQERMSEVAKLKLGLL